MNSQFNRGLAIRLVVALVVVSAVSGAVAATADEGPTVRIDTPRHDGVFVVGEEINFSVTVRDAQGRTVGNAAVVWTSQVDGEIGSGRSLVHDGLSVGNHRITCTVMDAGGKPLGVATIRIKVDYAQDEGPVDLTGVGGVEVKKGEDYFISPF
ncbi:hypothetical protein [Desulfatitalea alkaliphila]|uniref:Ig-like domain (Group 3) n=1 Tax=Desulfatitalea alkaliphila TaxID=2929485 RepID=A0AA41R152_9BACT|nr:hypothetical protein [Desulfatitalea alkaliphila]MCJ8498971.1 hypothetical protein [Desulfatitalea alkaliphila]